MQEGGEDVPCVMPSEVTIKMEERPSCSREAQAVTVKLVAPTSELERLEADYALAVAYQNILYKEQPIEYGQVQGGAGAGDQFMGEGAGHFEDYYNYYGMSYEGAHVTESLPFQFPMCYVESPSYSGYSSTSIEQSPASSSSSLLSPATPASVGGSDSGMGAGAYSQEDIYPPPPPPSYPFDEEAYLAAYNLPRPPPYPYPIIDTPEPEPEVEPQQDDRSRQ